MLLLKVILQVLAFSVALLLSVLDYWWHDKRTNRFKRARRAFVGLAILFLIGGIALTVFDDLNNNRKEKELRDQLKQLQNRSTDILEEQRGGDSYPFVSVGFLDEDLITFVLDLKGDYALRDVTINIQDADEQPTGLQGRELYDAIKRRITTYRVPLVMPKVVTELGPLDLKGKSERRFRIDIYTAYRKVGENLVLVKVGRQWKIAYRIVEEQTQIVPGKTPTQKLLEPPYIGPGFPPDKIPW